MSSRFFHIQEHVLPTQHIRSYPYATLHEDEEVLQMAIKQYTPLSNSKPKRGDVTIVATHANGLPKELYEPLWDELLQQSEKQGWRIRSIWIADMSNQGYSGVLNEDKLGCEPGWFDHPRDLLYMVNTFRMPRPMIGIGHSIGGNNLINLALMHPRLLDTLVLIDPVAAPLTKVGGEWGVAGEWGVLAASSYRRDKWPSRQAAEATFKKNKFYQSWDPRVLDLLVKHGLRETPTKLYPDSSGEVTLTTTKHQEIFSFSREYHAPRAGDPPDELMHPEARMYDNHGSPAPFYRAESHITFNNLPFLRPSVLYIFGEKSELTPWWKSKMETTGTADIGSGGAKAGKVKDIMMKDTGHLIPMEKVEETAVHTSEWIGKWFAEWITGDAALRKYWESVPEEEKYTLNSNYFDALKPPKGAKIPKL